MFGVGMAVVTIAMLSQTWEDQCTAPSVLNGAISSDVDGSWANGDAIDASIITCDSNYHLDTNSSTNLLCVCTADGEACEELQHACVAQLCSVRFFASKSVQLKRKNTSSIITNRHPT